MFIQAIIDRGDPEAPGRLGRALSLNIINTDNVKSGFAIGWQMGVVDDTTSPYNRDGIIPALRKWNLCLETPVVMPLHRNSSVLSSMRNVQDRVARNSAITCSTLGR